MAVETEVVKTSQTKEFETLLNEDFKRRDFKEGKLLREQ